MTSDARTNTSPGDDIEGYDLTILDRGAVSTIPLPASGELVIGRDAAAEVRLEGIRVSRRHATLVIEAGELAIEDHGSSNGTHVNRERLPANRRTPIARGDSIHIGELILIITPKYNGGPNVLDATRSPVFQALLHQLGAVAPADINVLILGETGVGKDVIARRIHADSPRRDGPFVRINCAALTETLLESELFGHERGAFSGAVQAKPGLLESAAHGTVFLDEVGELPAALQPKLLHAVENREITRVGSVLAREIDVRFVAATNRDLEAEVAAKRFRADLFYRLSTFVVDIPPLRERREDLPSLATELARQAADRFGIAQPAIHETALELLAAYAWPGNVRELRNVIERALVLGKGAAITPDLLPASLRSPTPRHEAAAGAPPDALGLSAKEQGERREIIQALVVAHGNQSQAARALGISRATLLQRLDVYRISRPRKRPTAPQ